MPDLILAIDQGTTSTRALVFSGDGKVIASGSAPLQTIYGGSGTAEQGPHEIVDSVIAATAAALDNLESRAGLRRSDVACAGIANQRETFVLWDETGQPVHPAVVWQCKRSVDICAELRAAGAEEEVRSRTGLIVDPYFSGTKLTSLIRAGGPVASALSQGRLRFGTVDS